MEHIAIQWKEWNIPLIYLDKFIECHVNEIACFKLLKTCLANYVDKLVCVCVP